MAGSAHRSPGAWERLRRDGDNSGSGLEGWEECRYRRWEPWAMFDPTAKRKRNRSPMRRDCDRHQQRPCRAGSQTRRAERNSAVFYARELLCPQLPAQPFKRLDDLRRPLRHFIFPQRALGRLKSSAQQHRILSRGNIAPAKNLDWNKAAQFRQAEPSHAPVNLLERYSLVEDKRKIPLHRRIARQRLDTAPRAGLARRAGQDKSQR